jgi:hypothetical protein
MGDKFCEWCHKWQLRLIAIGGVLLVATFVYSENKKIIDGAAAWIGHTIGLIFY